MSYYFWRDSEYERIHEWPWRDAADAGRSCDNDNRVNIYYSTITVRIMMMN